MGRPPSVLWGRRSFVWRHAVRDGLPRRCFVWLTRTVVGAMLLRFTRAVVGDMLLRLTRAVVWVFYSACHSSIGVMTV